MDIFQTMDVRDKISISKNILLEITLATSS